jgi:protocadherin Fat 1/2/3
VRYEIQTDTTNSSEYFHIDPEDGSIYLKRSLDHELHDSHHFTVVAIDAGVPSLSSTAHVWVTGMYREPLYCCYHQFLALIETTVIKDSD